MSALTPDAARGVHRLVRAAWSELPLWLAASALICAAAAAAAWLTPGITPLSVLVAVLVVAAPVGALLAMLVEVAHHRDPGWSLWGRALTRDGWAAVKDCAPAAVATGLLIVAIDVWHLSGQPLVLGSVGVCGAVSLLAWTVTAARLPLRHDRPDLCGREAWRIAAGLAAAAPLRHLTAPVLLALGVWVAVEIAASLLLLVPLPVAMVAVAAYWSTACELGLTTDRQRTDLSSKEIASCN